jgi:LDH2 family malate/lactate/ureidoglycolate dehydrogenase
MHLDVSELVRTTEAGERAFIIRALAAVGVDDRDAALVSEILTAADLRGIESHGIARLRWFYVDRIRMGIINPRPKYTTVRETPASILIDADNGLGHPVAHHAMERTIEKAKKAGIAFGAVRNSNHYGIAGYYAMMALRHDMVGISSTDSIHFAVPTFGRDRMQGTNPFAIAVPAGEEEPFVLDFATTTVTYGKLEVFERRGRKLEPNWAVDGEGKPTDDPGARHWGALLPLGGFGTEHGGHKGYGMGALSEILCGVLSGAPFGTDLSVVEGLETPGGITGHFFGAIRVDLLRELDEFKRDMDTELRTFKNSTPLDGYDRVKVAGEVEYETARAYAVDGIPHVERVWEMTDGLAAELGIPPMPRAST